MDIRDLLDERLLNQRISSQVPASPEKVVSELGAVQAQDYPASLWAIGLRSKSAKSDVEAVAARGGIARSWLNRGTLHFARSSDIRWMLKLFSPRLVRTAEARDRHLGLTDQTVAKTRALFRKALQGGRRLTRTEMYQVMAKGGVPASNNLGYHMLYRAAWDGVICFGPHSGKEPTFVLADEWLTDSPLFDRDQAVTELAARYYSSHGPATVKDFVWWSGLTVSDAKAGVTKAGSKLRRVEFGDEIYYAPADRRRRRADRTVHLLPAFDEYLLGYSDRSAILGGAETQAWIRKAKVVVVYSNGIFLPTLVVDGVVAGVWKRSVTKDHVVIEVNGFQELDKGRMSEAREAAEDYGRFLKTDASLKVV